MATSNDKESVTEGLHLVDTEISMHNAQKCALSQLFLLYLWHQMSFNGPFPPLQLPRPPSVILSCFPGFLLSSTVTATVSIAWNGNAISVQVDRDCTSHPVLATALLIYNSRLEQSALQFYFCIVNPLRVWLKDAFEWQFLIALRQTWIILWVRSF